jgi:hypothetical protein
MHDTKWDVAPLHVNSQGNSATAEKVVTRRTPSPAEVVGRFFSCCSVKPGDIVGSSGGLPGACKIFYIFRDWLAVDID